MPSDVRALQAREHHSALAGLRGQADMHRQERNRLVRMLRAEDAERWTYAALAAAIGCKEELIAAIVQGRTT